MLSVCLHLPSGQSHFTSIASSTVFYRLTTHVVTGGAGGLALEAVRALLERGLAGLALFDINPSQSKQAIEILRAGFPSANIITKTVSVTNATDVGTATTETATELGSVDILYCFVGVVSCTHAIDMSTEEWRSILDINTTGEFLCAQAVAKQVFPVSNLEHLPSFSPQVLQD